MSSRSACVALLLLAGLLWASPLSAATFTVTNTNDSGTNSLRWAINQANGAAGADTIAFNIAGGGVHTITTASALPAISTTMTLDGTTQPGYSDKPLVVLKGSSAGAGVSGLTITGANTVVRGLSVVGFTTHGVLISGGAGNVRVEQCWLGFDSFGYSTLANGHTGVWIAGIPNNTIGPGNVISGNTVDGVRIDQAGATGNTVKGNRIGLRPDEFGGAGNGFNGVVISAANNNVIGGTAGADLNIISGNAKNGIGIAGGASGNVIQRNYIGLGADGRQLVSNTEDGVLIIDSPNNFVGGSVGGTFNVISYNFHYGIEIRGAAATGNVIQRNIVGLDVSGTMGIYNAWAGVFIDGAPNTVIGSGAWGAGGNLISGNNGDGVDIKGAGATGTQIKGNRFGLDVSGNAVVKNGYYDIHLMEGAGSTTIGVPGAGNVLAGGTISGIEAQDSSNNVIQSNYIGTLASGNAPTAQRGGVSLYRNSSNNVVGGANANQRNIIGGYVSVGTDVLNSGNRIEGNWIGVGADGTSAIGGSGISTYGPATMIKNNVIAGSTGPGIYVSGEGSAIVGNRIGTDPGGTIAMGNASDGIRVSYARGLVIGGANAADRNVISANGEDGIDLENGTDETRTIYGNYIGTDANGTADLGNAGAGIHVTGSISNSGGNVIGGAGAGQGNLISGNGGSGVNVDRAGASNTLIRGNRIGTQADGSSALGNSGHGVLINVSAGSNSIGGAAAGEGNVIRSNALDGVSIAASSNNAVLGNSITANGGLGIDLGPDGVSANDAGDGDSGANDLQNYPVLVSAANDGTNLIISAGLNSEANATYRIEYFANASCDASGNGEGATLIGAVTANTDGNGNAGFSVTVGAGAAPIGQYVTATATRTDVGASTSEFSACRRVAPPAPVVGNSGPVCDRQTLSLSASAVTGSTFAWTGPNGFTSTLQYPSIANATTAASGTYTVVATLGGVPSAPAATTATVNACTITINSPPAVTEGNSGTVPLTFTVSLTGGSTQPVAVNWTTVDGSAVAPGDYAAGSGTLTIPANASSATITRNVVGDTLDESNENFAISLSSASAGSIGVASGTGTITDDDAANGQLRMSECVAEISELLTNIQLSVERVNGSYGAIGVSYATANGTAQAGSDFTSTSGTLSWASGDTGLRTVTVPLVNNPAKENREDFYVHLSSSTGGATLVAPSSSHVWILDGQDQVFVSGFDLIPPCN